MKLLGLASIISNILAKKILKTGYTAPNSPETRTPITNKS